MLTYPSVLARTVRLYADRPAILDLQGTSSWQQFCDRVGRAAGVLLSLGVERGQRYGLICRNGFRSAELICAGYWIGAVPVPINYRLAPPEIGFILDNAECEILILDNHFADLASTSELSPWFHRILLVAETATKSDRPEYDDLLRRASSAEMCECAEEDDAILLYTGGTTGRPKGVPLSHKNVVSNALQLGFELGPRSDDVYLHVAPMFHSADLLATPFILTGAAHVFLPKFSGKSVLEAIQRWRVTVTLMTPTMLIMTMQEPEIDHYDLSSLRQLIYGSSPMAVEWITRIVARFRDVEIVQAYGLTETSPILTLLHAVEHEQAVSTGKHDVLRSVGRQMPAVEMKIVDDQGRDLAVGEPGEVVVRGPNVVNRYLKRPEETKAAFRGGWFYTGDIARMDETGYLYLLDRKKDLIITGGEIVFSSEVEAVLYQNPKIHECAVIGVPDETYGESLLAAVVPTTGASLTEDELIAHCRGKIGGYKIPRRYVFLDHLPKSAMDKILKTELRRAYSGKA